jgi:DNA transformation protein
VNSDDAIAFTRVMVEKKLRRRALGHALRVSDSYKRFVLDQLEELGDVRPRSMFGGVGLYHRDVFFGIVAADVLYLKADDTTRGDFERAGMGPFRPFPERGGGTKYYAVPLEVLESAAELGRWARRAVDVAKRARLHK